jgi:spectinomycin phosphotransferase
MQSDRLILIDWEGMKLAPPEADLFAFIGNLFWHNCSDKFMKTYQSVHKDFEINIEVLEFYQTRCRIEDICAFAQGLLYDKNIDETERNESLYYLQLECEVLSRQTPFGVVILYSITLYSSSID